MRTIFTPVRGGLHAAMVSLILFVISGFVICGFLTTSADAQTSAPHRPGQVYLMRGLFNVFSLGMDELAAKLENVGVKAEAVSYTSWSSLADSITAQYRAGNREPIILMGHSYGADTTISLARKLNENRIPVALIVNFDPTAPDRVPPNVRRIINFYVPTAWGRPVEGGKRFRGSLANLNESGKYSHFGIDKADDLHRKAIAAVLQAVGRGTHRVKRPAKRDQVSAAPAQ
jgi:pimeloyl-ACP methyl ester carboxylesterase